MDDALRANHPWPRIRNACEVRCSFAPRGGCRAPGFQTAARRNRNLVQAAATVERRAPTAPSGKETRPKAISPSISPVEIDQIVDRQPGLEIADRLGDDLDRGLRVGLGRDMRCNDDTRVAPKRMR